MTTLTALVVATLASAPASGPTKVPLTIDVSSLQPTMRCEAASPRFLNDKEHVSRVVFATVQDTEGYIWLGTQDGLARFDGLTLRSVRLSARSTSDLSPGSEEPEPTISGLADDHAGGIWIRTNEAGLLRRFKDGTNIRRYLDSELVTAMASGPSGVFLVGTNEGAVWRFEPTRDEFLRLWAPAVEVASPVLAIQPVGKEVWLATESTGFHRLTTSPAVVELPLPAHISSQVNGAVSTFRVAEDGSLWIGTSDVGVIHLHVEAHGGQAAHYRYSQRDPKSISDDSVTSILEDPDGRVWIGTRRNLNLFDPSTRSFVRLVASPGDAGAIGHPWIQSLYLDRERSLWVASWGGGACRISRSRRVFAHYRDKSAVGAIHVENADDIWFGGYGYGFGRLDRKRSLVTRYELAGFLTVPLAMIRFQGRIWIGSDSPGLVDFDPDRNAATHHNPEDLGVGVFALTVDRAGRLWAGTWGKGLARVTLDGENFSVTYLDVEDGLPSEHIYTIVEDVNVDDLLWIGFAEGGLAAVRTDGKLVASYQRPASDPATEMEGLSNDNVTYLHQDRSGVLWIGTWGGGLNRLDPMTKTVKRYSVHEGLPSPVIWAIEGDSRGALWLSTAHGLSRFDPASESFSNFDTTDGLQSLEYSQGSHAMAPNGDLIFGGSGGLNIFDPRSVALNDRPPSLSLSEVSVSGKILPVGSFGPRGAISYQDNLHLVFSSLSFSAPEKNSYSFRLEGVHDWTQPSAVNSVTYTRLGGGEVA